MIIFKKEKYRVINWPNEKGDQWIVTITETGYTKGCYNPICKLEDAVKAFQSKGH